MYTRSWEFHQDNVQQIHSPGSSVNRTNIFKHIATLYLTIRTVFLRIVRNWILRFNFEKKTKTEQMQLPILLFYSMAHSLPKDLMAGYFQMQQSINLLWPLTNI